MDKRDIAHPLDSGDRVPGRSRPHGIGGGFADPPIPTRRRGDHAEASEPYTIFRVPIILYHGAEPTFVKLAAGAWEGADDLELFDDLAKLATRPYVLKVKNPPRRPGSGLGGTQLVGQ